MSMKNITQLQESVDSRIIASIILSIGFILGLWIYSQRSNTDEAITITGSAKEAVTANLATYNLSFDKTYPAATGLTVMMADFKKKTEVITGYLKYKTIAPEKINV